MPGKAELEVIIKGKDEASAKMKKIGGGMDNMAMKARKAGLAFAVMGAAIVGAMAMSVKAYVKAGDALAKMAIRTGFSIESLSRLKHAADLSGTSIEGLEKASRFLTRSIVFAGDGLETYARAFRRINLSYEDLIKLSPEKQFLKVLTAITALENSTTRITVATELFGSRIGTQLLPLMERGVEGLQAMMTETDKLNLVWSVDSAQAAVDLNDAMTRVEGAVNGLKFAIAEALIPTIEPLVENLKELIIQFKDWAKENPELVEGLAKIGIILAIGGPVLLGLSFFITTIGGAITTVRTLTIALTTARLAMLGMIGGIAVGVGMIGFGVMGLMNIEKQKKAIRDMADALEQEYIKTLSGLDNKYAELIIQAEAMGFVFTEQARQWAEATIAAQAYAGALGEVFEGIKNVQMLLAAGGAGQAAYVRAYGPAWVLSAATPGRTEAIRYFEATGTMTGFDMIFDGKNVGRAIASAQGDLLSEAGETG